MRAQTVAGRGRSIACALLLSALLAAICVAPPAGAAAARTRTRAGGASFAVRGILLNVAATSARNAWAVGQTGELPGPAKALIAHWNGKAWRRIPTPRTALGAALEGVTATSVRSAWAVGCTGCLSDTQRGLIEHWNGKAWQRVASPSVVAHSGLLYGVTMGAHSGWAVGFTGYGGPPKTVILRWNGSVWTHVASPNPPGGGVLVGVAAASAASAWAVGYADGSPKALILRWNGTVWKRVPIPDLAGTSSSLYAVAATSTRSAWAVGCTACFGPHPKSLTEHWNGAVWQRVPSPTSAGGATLDGVAVRSAGGAWAVGFTGTVSDRRPRPVILRWNGSAWRQEPVPDPGGTSSLYAVAVSADRGAWAVGQTGSYGSAKPKTVILRWNGTSWQ
ncbi:MAG: hypothetical protein ACLQFR_14595 [Streptosporangiaceae bacterium]